MNVPFPIDAVIPWVDGSDPALAARRARYLDGKAATDDEVAGETRYRSVGEIRYAVASILRFAPWIRHIYIVTDGQDPSLGEMLSAHFPERLDDVSVVDHRVIFRGREEFLPVFNSRSIDTLIWNIPSLSEHFIYFNDDFAILRPVFPEDFFPEDGKVVCYGNWYPVALARLLRAIRPSHVGFKTAMLTAWEKFGTGRRFILLSHTPRPMLKSWFEEWEAAYPALVEGNLHDKFRNVRQFQAQEPFCLSMAQSGRLVLRPDGPEALYFKPKGLRHDRRRFARLRKDRSHRFLCLNSLDRCEEPLRTEILRWLDGCIFDG